MSWCLCNSFEVIVAEILHIKVFRAGIGRMGFYAVAGDEDVDHDDGGERDGLYADTPREAVDRLMARIENDAMLRAWEYIAPYRTKKSAGRSTKPKKK